MTPEQIVLVQSSFDQLLPASAAVAREFYVQLFTLDPTLRPHFPADMRKQEQMLMVMLNTSVNGLWYPDALLPVLHRLGQRHAGYGVQPGHYTTVGVALIATLRQFLGHDFSAEVEVAWWAAYRFMAETMQAGVTDRVISSP